MPDQEKVIRGIECCLNFVNQEECPEECPYRSDGGCWEAIKRDALALLKEQEPRVMTEGDVLHSTGKPMWFESRGMYLGRKGFWCLSFEVDPEQHIRFVQSISGGKITLSLIDYGKVWRAWTSRPTEERRKAVPWEADNNA